MAPKSVAGILNKVANLEGIDQDEYNELSGFAQKYPQAAPLLDRLMEGGKDALSPEEHFIIQKSIEGSLSSRDAQQARDRAELEATANRGTGIGTKLKDLAASFGVGSAGVPETIQRGIGFAADALLRGAAAKAGVPEDQRNAFLASAGIKSPTTVAQDVSSAIPLAELAQTDALKTMYEGMKSPELKARQQLSQERAEQAYQGKGGGVLGTLAEAGSKAKDL